jgi:hypothetical protein
VEISENSEKCLSVRFYWLQSNDNKWVGRQAEKVAEKPQGEGKAVKIDLQTGTGGWLVPITYTYGREAQRDSLGVRERMFI